MKNSEIKEAIIEAKAKLAGELEDLLRYKEAIDIWEELGRHDEAKRVRKKKRDESRVNVDQTVVHGTTSMTAILHMSMTAIPSSRTAW